MTEKEEPYQDRFCPNCRHETYFNANKCECCKNTFTDFELDKCAKALPKKADGISTPKNSLTREQAHLISMASMRLREAKERASARMRDLCMGCLYKTRVECPLESVKDLETLNALVPENCKNWKPRFGWVERG